MQNKDIGQFKSFEELFDALNNTEEPELTDRQKERRMRKAYSEADLVFSNSQWEVWVPKSFAGSCTLGKGTKWCTAYSDDDGYYKEYSSQGPLYILINKSDKSDKYQFHFESGQYMNKEDVSIDHKEFSHIFKNNEDLAKFFLHTQGFDEEITINLTEDQYAYMVSEWNHSYRRSRDFLSEDIINACIHDNYTGENTVLDYFDGYDYVYYLESSELPNYCDSDNTNTLLELLEVDSVDEIDLDEIDSNITAAIIRAYEVGAAVGRSEECYEMVIDDIKSVWKSTIFSMVDNNIFSLKYNPDEVSSDKVLYSLMFDVEEINAYDSPLDNLVCSLFVDAFDCREPYYGFSEFSEDAFNDSLSNDLWEYQNK